MEKEVLDYWVMLYPTTKGLLNKPFPYYNELAYDFGRDRVMGCFAETFTDVGSNEPTRYEGFDMSNGNAMYSQGIDVSQENVRAL
uniref:Retrotransposon protein n=1 Tax=Cucumis melo TaxID=3656 RepID=A0A9I9DDU0_CUCME